MKRMSDWAEASSLKSRSTRSVMCEDGVVTTELIAVATSLPIETLYRGRGGRILDVACLAFCAARDSSILLGDAELQVIHCC